MQLQSILQRSFGFRHALGVTGVKSYSVTSEIQTAKPFSEIPTIPEVPILGAGWTYLPYIGRYKLTALHHAAMSKYKEYGPIVRERLNRDVDVVHLFETEDIQHVLRHEGRYPYRRPLQLLKKYREERRDVFQNIGIFINNGEEWYQVRSHVQPHMMKPKAVRTYMEPMDEVAMQMVKNTERFRKSNGGEVKDYLSELYKWALESVGVVALDARLGCLDVPPNQESTKVVTLISEVLLMILRLEFGPLPLWKYIDTPMKKKLYKKLDDFSEFVIKYLTAAKERLRNKSEDHETTFLETLISTTKDPRHITTMIIDMFFAGIDTTSTTVGLTLYHLARNREAQDKAYLEVKSVLQQYGMCSEAINEIRFLKACVKESMRLNPIVSGIGRSIPEDIVVHGYKLPAGTTVILHSYVVGRLEKNFSDPLTYRPERFLRESGNHDPFAFLPFGFGPRSCVGRRIAEQEIWVLLMRILERFRVVYPHGEVDMTTRLINTPDKPLHFQFYDR